MAKKDFDEAVHKGTGRVPAKKHPRNPKKFRDETPRKDYKDYTTKYPDVLKDGKVARRNKERGIYTNADEQNLTVLKATKKHMELIDAAHRKQPAWDQEYITLCQKIKAKEAGK